MADDQVFQVKQATDIVEVIGTRVQLKKAGRNYKGLCPFHGEKTPSFFVSAEMQMYKCFGCGVSGDVLSFVQEYEGISFPEALEQLADRSGIKLEKRKPTEGEKNTQELLQILHLAQEYYQFLLTEHKVGAEARDYLQRRGVHKRMWKVFGLGYAPESWRAWSSYMNNRKNFGMVQLEQAGMVIRSESGRYYDRFRGRLMFPLRNFSGKTVGFSGRLLAVESKEAKYINTPETQVYHKGEMLYGMYENKQGVREKDRVLVVEGEMDVISSVQAGVKEVVAVKGSALTEAQVLLIRRLTKNVVLAMDADLAGQEAMKRAIEIAEPKGMNIRVLKLSGGKDPDEVAREDAKNWREMSKKTVSVYQFYIDQAFELNDADSGQGQKQISITLAPILARIANAVERDYYVRKLADRLGVAKRVVEEEVVKADRENGRSLEERVVEVPNKKMSRQELVERYAITTGLQWGAKISREWSKLKPEWFSEVYLRKLVVSVDELIDTDKQLSLSQIQENIEEEMKPLLMELYGADDELLLVTQEELGQIFEKAVHELKQMYIRRRMNELNREMSNNSQDESKLMELREEYQRLKRL